MKIKFSLSTLLLALASCLPAGMRAQMADFHVVPLPKEVKSTQAGVFQLTPKTLITYSKSEKGMKEDAEFLAQYIKESTGLELQVTAFAAQRNCIRLTSTLKDPNPEAYQIRVNSELILLEGASAAGTFYAVQTLRKALPVGTAGEQGIAVPACEVRDAPRFAYRGAMLDVSRHFISPDSVRRFIDMIALHNINRMHWHLSDDQGWRIEIKKYPLLTKVGSHRDQTVIGHNSGEYDGIPYEGFYTQKEVKEIVEYAQERHITIIPEIDMPGHMLAALTAYPELGCTGGPYKVWEQWGVSDDVLCAGNDKTLEFIDNVLAEIVKIFPSEYIHVGGDECPKTRWAECPKCQARIQAEGLQADEKHTAEERLQSYVIKHAEATLGKLGRKMIGWDETLEGGLAPNATVMSWRGEGGGIEAAKQKHDVIMTPNTYLYFDYYQSSDVKNEPIAIGGYLPIEHVYSYEPMPRSLSPEEHKYIIGVQANLWTEYIPTFKQVEYMELPRMAALSEIQWCAPEQKDFKKFMQRLPRLISLYNKKGYNYAKTIFNVNPEFSTDVEAHAVKATLSTYDHADIHYTLDGSEPTLQSPKYAGPVEIRESAKLRAAAFRPIGKTPEVTEDFTFHKAAACGIELLQPSNRAYTFAGAPLLVDGLIGKSTNYKTGRWIGFAGTDLEAVIDLGEEKEVSSVAIHTCVEKGDWIFDARGFEVLASANGETYSSLAVENYPAMLETDPNQIYTHTLGFTPTSTRFLKVVVKSEHSIPEWHGGSGHSGFLFVDEIEVQ